MTVLIGVLCRDGSIIGSDSASTFAAADGSYTIEQSGKKVHVIDDRVIVAGTGEVGLSQRFLRVVEAYHASGGFARRPYIQVGTDLCREALKDFTSTGLNSIGMGALVAFYDSQNQFRLCEFSAPRFQPEFKDPPNTPWFVSMGSGQKIADPFLGLLREAFWQDTQPNCREGLFSVTWALHHVIKLNTGGIGDPKQIAILSGGPGQQPVAKILTEDELAEHKNFVEGMIKHISQYKDIIQGLGAQDIPDAPVVPAQEAPAADPNTQDRA